MEGSLFGGCDLEMCVPHCFCTDFVFDLVKKNVAVSKKCAESLRCSVKYTSNFIKTTKRK